LLHDNKSNEWSWSIIRLSGYQLECVGAASKDRIPRHRHPRRHRRGCRRRGMRSLCNSMCRRNVRTPPQACQRRLLVSGPGASTIRCALCVGSAVDAQLHDGDSGSARSERHLVAARRRRLRFRNHVHRALPATRYARRPTDRRALPASFAARRDDSNCAILLPRGPAGWPRPKPRPSQSAQSAPLTFVAIRGERSTTAIVSRSIIR